MNDVKNEDILKDKQDHDRMSWMEELRMIPVYQVFIMVLVQGATRSGFHHRKNLFIFTFATKAPVSRFSPRHIFFFFLSFFFKIFFIEFLERIQTFFNLNSAPIGRISQDHRMACPKMLIG